MKEKKNQSKYKPSTSPETLQKWIKPDFKISTLKDAMSGWYMSGGDFWGYS